MSENKIPTYLDSMEPELPANCNHPCGRKECPGPMGWDVGYGLAGGGCGVYHYCAVCDEIKDKMQDPL